MTVGKEQEMTEEEELRELRTKLAAAERDNAKYKAAEAEREAAPARQQQRLDELNAHIAVQEEEIREALLQTGPSAEDMLRDVSSPTGTGRLVALGEGVYTVPETCRILRPSMTARKVHYWLDTSLLGPPLRIGRRGVPTLLSFGQVLRVRTLQRLRDELSFPLQQVRRSLEALLRYLESDDWHDVYFFRTGGGDVGVAPPYKEPIAVLTGQLVMDDVLPGLSRFIAQVRMEWERRQIAIEGFNHLVSDAAVLGGAPVIVGTRIETAFVKNLASEMALPELTNLFPNARPFALMEAAKFEGVSLMAA